MQERLSVWLLPAGDDLSALRAHVERIAQQLGSPPFVPHITLTGGLRAERAAVARVLAEVAPRLRSLSLQPRSVATSRSRFQALTLTFESSSAALELTQELATRLHVEPTPVSHLHLSLAYPLEPFDPAVLPPLAADISLKHPLRFDALSLVTPGRGHDDWQAVEDWETVGSYGLDGAGSVDSHERAAEGNDWERR